MPMDVAEIVRRLIALEVDARRVLAIHEESPSRAITLEQSYKRLGKLSLAQDELFRESLRAVEGGLFRASHVLAWAGFIDFFHNHIVSVSSAQLIAVRPSWTIRDPDDLREYADFQVIEAAREARVINKTVMKALHGLLNKRNEAAHPSDYFPNLNETLGYVTETFHRIESLLKKTL